MSPYTQAMARAPPKPWEARGKAGDSLKGVLSRKWRVASLGVNGTPWDYSTGPRSHLFRLSRVLCAPPWSVGCGREVMISPVVAVYPHTLVSYAAGLMLRYKVTPRPISTQLGHPLLPAFH